MYRYNSNEYHKHNTLLHLRSLRIYDIKCSENKISMMVYYNLAMHVRKFLLGNYANYDNMTMYGFFLTYVQ